MKHDEVFPAPVFTPCRFAKALFWALLLAAPLLAQTKPLSENELNDYLKALLTEYYTGKPVYAKVAIPATERGLSVLDGRLETPRGNTTASPAAQPGTALIIRQLKFQNKNIEVQFDADGASDESRAAPTRSQRLATGAVPQVAPRLNLRFSRSITTRDLTIQNLNHLLSAALDITALIPKTTEPPAADAASPPSPKRPDAAMLAERAAQAQGIPSATVVSDLSATGTETGELTIECSTAPARIYIDGAYSGWAPRTVKLLTGIHSILIVSEGYEMWEQKFFVPGGKASRMRAELKR